MVLVAVFDELNVTAPVVVAMVMASASKRESAAAM
jgi:hypothetical protein